MNDRQLEHRLTKIEVSTEATRVDVAEIKDHLKEQNGAVRKHFAEDLTWMTAHDKDRAHSAGFRSGQMSIITAVVTLASIAGGIIAKVAFG